MDLPLFPVSETEIMRDTLVELSRQFHPDGIFWRQNVGLAWMGKTTHRPDGSIVIKNPRPVKFGTPGQPDIMGCLDGQFVGIESKTETGRQREDQKNWAAALSKAGGHYFIARSPDDAVAFLRKTVRG